MYDEILLPFDGSDGAAKAVYHTAEIAHWADATVRILFVADTTRDSLTVVETQVVDALVEEGASIVEEAAKTLETLGVDHHTDVVQGNPAPTIVTYADRYDYDLIVLPTHGREGISRYLLGSVTEKVVRLSSVPVLTARMHADEKLEFPYERILIPTDGSDAAVAAAEHAISLAESLDATVHVLSVVEDSFTGLHIGSGDTEDRSTQAATAAVTDLVSRAEERGVPNTVRHIKEGSPSEQILELIDTEDIHAVVMGTTGRRGSDRILLGSVAEKTVRFAPVPVITIASDT